MPCKFGDLLRALRRAADGRDGGAARARRPATAASDEPVATGLVTQDAETEVFGYLIEDLLAGNYVAAFTCTGSDFVPVDGKAAVIAIGDVTPLSVSAEDAPAP